MWAHFKLYKCHEKREYEGFADKAWCDHCHKPFVKENSTLLRHLQRHHKKALHDVVAHEETSTALAHNESTLKLKKGHIEQFFSSKSVPLTNTENDTAMQLLAQAWYDNLLPPLLADSLVKLKTLLQQSTSVSLTTDAAKMPTGDSYVAVTCHWISMDWCLMSAVLGVSISNVSHLVQKR